MVFTCLDTINGWIDRRKVGGMIRDSFGRMFEDDGEAGG